MNTGSIKFADVRGVRTRYYEKGQGQPLVLVHGGHYGFSDSLDMWNRNLEPLASQFHVYALDRLGQGYTDNPAEDADFTFDAAYVHLSAWLEGLDITGAHVVGHSRGALFAALLALDQPERVRTVVLVDTRTLAPDDSRFPVNQAYRNAVARATAKSPTAETVRVEPDANSYSTEHVDEELTSALLEIYRLSKTELAQRRMERLEEHVFLPSIARNKQQALERIDREGFAMPALVLWGVNDPTAQLGLGHLLYERVCARTARAELHVLNQAGHYSFRERPAEFNTTLSAFCAS